MPMTCDMSDRQTVYGGTVNDRGLSVLTTLFKTLTLDLPNARHLNDLEVPSQYNFIDTLSKVSSGRESACLGLMTRVV